MGSVTLHKSGKRPLGETELIAIAVGGMIGGGIFSVLGVAAGRVGYEALYSLLIGGLLALLSVYSYAKLARHFKDEGASYSFFKRAFKGSHSAASTIGWIVIFGYISTLALYATTFGSYLAKALNLPSGDTQWAASGLLALFTLINLVSVKGMGVLEDLLVYAKLVGIAVISLLFLSKGHQVVLPYLGGLAHHSIWNIFSTAALTYVAYEGFQLAINAFRDVDRPAITVPRSMYKAVVVVIVVYLLLALGAFQALPLGAIISGQEFALAAGAKSAVGTLGYAIVIMSALFATTSALSGTLYGASRMLAVIATDGYMPSYLKKRSSGGIPRASIITMAVVAWLLIMSGSLVKILEFGSLTFMASSLLMAIAALKVAKTAQVSRLVAGLTIVGLSAGLGLLLIYQLTQESASLWYTLSLYVIIALSATYFSRRNNHKEAT